MIDNTTATRASRSKSANSTYGGNRFPAEPPPLGVVPAQDTREQNPWIFANLAAPVIKTLNVGDYSYVGGESICRLERKSGPDYLSSIFTERFNREMEVIRAYPCHALIIEESWEWLESGDYRSKATPQQVTGKTLGFIESGVRVILAGNRERAQQIAERLIYMCARRRWRESRELIRSVLTGKEVNE